ncbi:MAG: hypothetical protein JW751_13275 [Polyangiaceae bacterium]|nr:hypothetical protein [Polyangiaceae bacterium]
MTLQRSLPRSRRAASVAICRVRVRVGWARGALAGLVLVVFTLLADAVRASPLREAANATTELDVARATALLAQVNVDAAAVTIERARLAIYRGDCLSAAVILDASTLVVSPDLEGLSSVAHACAQATAGASIVEDAERGVWIRLQDARDRALVPFVTAVAGRARSYLEREIGIAMPRPLRIELVRDLFSLAALTGLPLEAAETTGTVGVARWGRIILLSPRATPRGYPWEDTLAHELVHLFVTRASRDRAPLWLQEGIAKGYETRWRSPRPFDDETDHDSVAAAALRSGRAVGLDGLGQSIALLPTPELAASAYSEVSSFVHYLESQQGTPALRLLLADLRGLGVPDPNPALRSATGYDLGAWRTRWESALRIRPGPPPTPTPVSTPTVRSLLEVRDLVRRVRLAELLSRRGHHEGVVRELGPALAAHPREPNLRWRAARASLGLGRSDQAHQLLGEIADVDSAHGGWFALRGRFAQEANDHDRRDSARSMAVALDPLLEDVGCLGYPRLGGSASSLPEFDATITQGDDHATSTAGDWNALCQAARAIRRN